MKLVHGSLFSGFDAPSIAASWMGWENAFHCEINDFCNEILKYWFPNSEHYEDITKTDFSQWRGRIDILTGGFPCFIAGTPVLTERGFLPIEEIRTGYKVLSTDGKYHEVECLMVHQANEIVYLRAQGMFEELKCTPNHSFYVCRKKSHGYMPPEYIHASELKKGDKVGYPIHEGTDVSFTTAFWKLIGAWIADGWIDNQKRISNIPQGYRGSRVNSRNHKVIICCGKKNISRLHHIIQKAGYKYTLSEDNSTFRCIICDKSLCDFLKDFGKYAHGKHLSHQCFKLDNDRKKALLEGWFADGYKDKNGSIKVTTVSKSLAMDMAQLARDVYRCPVNISRKKCNRICIIEGREVNERPQYCVTISNSKRYGFFKDGIVWCNIKHISYEKEENQVFNLSVNEEHSYNVYGIAVHNCQPFSVAGQRKGADDNRYLWPHMLRAIREIRPTWVIGENVAGILTMVQPGEETEMGSQTSIFGEDNRKRVLLRQEYVVETICKDLEREGYSVQPMLIPACAVGAPHRRDRVWFVARLTTDTACHGSGGTSHESCRENKRQNWDETEQSFVRSEIRVATNTNGNGHLSCKPSGKTEGCWRSNFPQPEKWRNTSEWVDGLSGLSRDVADSQCPGSGQIHEEVQPEKPDGDCVDCNGNEQLTPHSTSQQSERMRFRQSEYSIQEQGKLGGIGSESHYNIWGGEYSEEKWRNFPTQSPVCRGNDGLPFDVGDLTIPFTKWRQESVKGYGNAIVPQVILEIFKAIEEVEQLG